jgi:hypothetical protein
MGRHYLDILSIKNPVFILFSTPYVIHFVTFILYINIILIHTFPRIALLFALSGEVKRRVK